MFCSVKYRQLSSPHIPFSDLQKPDVFPEKQNLHESHRSQRSHDVCSRYLQLSPTPLLSTLFRPGYEDCKGKRVLPVPPRFFSQSLQNQYDSDCPLLRKGHCLRFFFHYLKSLLKKDNIPVTESILHLPDLYMLLRTTPTPSRFLVF